MANKKIASNYWDGEKFCKFLVDKQKISERVAKNYLSRCRRIETMFGIDLFKETSSVDLYLELAEKIGIYAEKHLSSNSEVVIFTGTLRLAMKKFALYAHGAKLKLPRSYRKVNLSR